MRPLGRRKGKLNETIHHVRPSRPRPVRPALGPPAFAGQATSTFQVTASVAANCTISSSSIAFGGYDPINANDMGPQVPTWTPGLDHDQMHQRHRPYMALTRGRISSVRGIWQVVEISWATRFIRKRGEPTCGAIAAQIPVRTLLPAPNSQIYPTFGRVPRGQDPTRSRILTALLQQSISRAGSR